MVVITIWLAWASPVLAFRTAEHRELGDVGYLLALRHLEQSSPEWGLVTAEVEALRPPSGPDGGAPSYGDLVAVADFIKDPSQLLAVSATPEAGAAAFPRVNLKGLTRLAKSFGQVAAALHDNEHHFGSLALHTFWFWHRTALETAAREGDLLTALALNAYADHHLHDLHAPGHLLTRKIGMPDAAAKALHDAYNAGGHTYEIDRAAFEKDMAPLLLEMRSEGVFDQFRTPRPPDDAVERLLRFDGPRQAVEFFGDGSLQAHPEERIILALLTARSILDVLESFAAHEAKNSFAAREWQDYRVVSEGGHQRVMTPLLRLPYGGFPSVPLDSHPGTPFSKGGHVAMLPVWAVTAGLDSISAGGAFMSDGRLDLESVWLWHLPIPPRSQPRPTASRLGFAASTGLTLRGGDGGWQAGALVRLIKPLPSVEAQFSFGISPRWMKGSAMTEPVFRTGVEGRFEWGFGLAFVGVGISRDYRIARFDTAPVHGWGVTTSLSLMLTPGLFKHLGLALGRPN